MRRKIDDERLMLRVGDMYYNAGMGQVEIANQLKLSRPTIARLLVAARERGIVKIIVENVNGRNDFELEQQLVQRFNLRDAIVLPSRDAEHKQIEQIGIGAASFIKRILREGDVVGVSSGAVLGRIARNIQTTHYRSLTFVAMQGGEQDTPADEQANALCAMLSSSIGGDALPLLAPYKVTSPAAREAILSQSIVMDALKKTREMQIALCTIQPPPAALEEKGARAMVCGWALGENGQRLHECNADIIGVDIDLLRQVPYAIGIAMGVSSAPAVVAALKDTYLGVLLLDAACAKAVLQLMDEGA